MPALQKACSAARVTGAASFMVILRIYLERVNGGLLRSSIFFFFSFERVTTEMDFGRSKTDWKHFGVISERESEGMFSFMLLSFQRLAAKSIHPWLSHYYFSFLFIPIGFFAPRIVLFVALTIFLNSNQRCRCVWMCRRLKMLELFDECLRPNA